MIERGVLTLIVPGDGGLTSSVANAGALVSPALISPPSPLDRLRMRGFSMLLGPPRGVNSSAVERSGNDSVAGILDCQVWDRAQKKLKYARFHIRRVRVVGKAADNGCHKSREICRPQVKHG
jgi:hypothetical protein